MSAQEPRSSATFLLVTISCCLWIVAICVSLFGFDPGPLLPAGSPIWAIYFVLETVFPIIALTAMNGTTSARVRFAIAVIGIFLVLDYVLQTRHFGALFLGFIELLIAWPLVRFTFRHEMNRGWSAWTMTLVLIGSWTIFAALPWATPIETLLKGQSPYTIGYSAAIALILATVWGTVSLTRLNARGTKSYLRFADMAALALFAIAALRSDLKLSNDDLHVSFFFGPVDAVRQGGWLLWDVPSQYGIGNIWLAAHMPAHSSYGSFAYTNCAALFVAATLSYAIARTWVKTISLAAYCALAIAATDFFVSGYYIQMTGPEHWPSVGAFRFIWSYVLLGLVVLAYNRGWFSKAPRAVLLTGNICWAFAVCWSFEAAIFATIIWFPTSAAIVLLTIRSVKEVLYSWLRASLGLLVICIIVFVAFLSHFHHGPDWYAFLEYALVYKSGLASLPLLAVGSVWVLIASFATVVSVGIYAWNERRVNALPVLTAAAALQWSSASYFVFRSHENNVNNLLPLVLVGLLATMAVISKEKFTGTLPTGFRLLFVPLLALPLGLMFGAASLATKTPMANGWLVGNAGQWSALARPITPALTTLLRRNRLTSTSPILYIEPGLFAPPHWPGSDAMPALWTPGFSRGLIGLLPADRQAIYFRRFATDGHPTTGYLVQDGVPGPEFATLSIAALNDVYNVQNIDHEGAYVLTRYSLKH